MERDAGASPWKHDHSLRGHACRSWKITTSILLPRLAMVCIGHKCNEKKRSKKLCTIWLFHIAMENPL